MYVLYAAGRRRTNTRPRPMNPATDPGASGVAAKGPPCGVPAIFVLAGMAGVPVSAPANQVIIMGEGDPGTCRTSLEYLDLFQIHPYHRGYAQTLSQPQIHAWNSGLCIISHTGGEARSVPPSHLRDSTALWRGYRLQIRESHHTWQLPLVRKNPESGSL